MIYLPHTSSLLCIVYVNISSPQFMNTLAYEGLDGYIPDTDETLVSSRVSRDFRVSVSVSDSYKPFSKSRSRTRSRIYTFTIDDVTSIKTLCKSLGLSLESREIQGSQSWSRTRIKHILSLGLGLSLV